VANENTPQVPDPPYLDALADQALIECHHVFDSESPAKGACKACIARACAAAVAAERARWNIGLAGLERELLEQANIEDGREGEWEGELLRYAVRELQRKRVSLTPLIERPIDPAAPAAQPSDDKGKSDGR
jgi:hypothetical protein